jgi:hypothetical protein
VDLPNPIVFTPCHDGVFYRLCHGFSTLLTLLQKVFTVAPDSRELTHKLHLVMWCCLKLLREKKGLVFCIIICSYTGGLLTVILLYTLTVVL